MNKEKVHLNRGRYPNWSEQEFEILRKYFPLVESELSKAELATKLPGRSWSAIQTRGNAIHLVRGQSLWKRGELFLLRKVCFNCGVTGIPKEKLLSTFPNKSWEAILEKIKTFKLDKVISEKLCIHCKLVKPITEFGTNFKTSDSYKSWCEQCSNDGREHYYEQHPEKIYETYRRAYESLKGRYRMLTFSARSRKIKLDLSMEEFVELMKKPCYYCEQPLDPTGAGLDRINNDKSVGYIESNVLPCCARCNKTRGDWWTVEETKVMIQAVLKFQKSKEIPTC